MMMFESSLTENYEKNRNKISDKRMVVRCLKQTEIMKNKMSSVDVYKRQTYTVDSQLYSKQRSIGNVENFCPHCTLIHTKPDVYKRQV